MSTTKEEYKPITGCYRRAYIAALRQAKFYPPRQAAAAVAGSTSSIEAAAVHELQNTSWIIPHVLRLVWQLCIWLLWPQYMSRSTQGIKEYLGAKVGVDALQYKPFYTVPPITLWNNRVEFEE